MSKLSNSTPLNDESYKPFLLYAIVFVVIIVLVVAAKGGGNFYSRVQRLDALRISIQSDDPAREAINDPEKDIALIETFMLPSPDSHKRAEEYYNAWRANKNWDVSFGTTSFIETFKIATVERVVQWSRPGKLRLYGESNHWEEQDRIWYLKKIDEILLKEQDTTPTQPVVP